ncbi:hypothetical protein [Sneathiella sp.]|jgi:hypothetical protein|uniref:hypothetical protein n=1 Tax=Sneathiella sp. TaxID=1964365 RepID=UPI0025E8CDC7|nr:hypothetical protein [Sneathiella sp.]
MEKLKDDLSAFTTGQQPVPTLWGNSLLPQALNFTINQCFLRVTTCCPSMFWEG